MRSPPGSRSRAVPSDRARSTLLAELAAAPTGELPAADLAARHGPTAAAGLVRRGLAEAEVRERPRRPLAARPAGRRGGRPAASDLLPAQAEAVDRIVAAIAARDPRPLLLDGVTGGGKTAIYVEAIAASLEAGRPALVLVPEIALALPLVDRLRADLDARVALVHSGLGEGERSDEWRRIRAGDVDIVVGTRLAVVAPLADVGVIIVDEEHDAAYKSDRTPRLQARDVAIRLAGLAGAAIVLGSATPAVESVGRARTGDYDRVVLPARPVGAAPTVEVVDLRAELAAGQRGLLSRSLSAALAGLDTAGGEQAILVLNRRGHGLGRAVPRLRLRPGLPGLRATARLSPGRDDAALPPLRPGDPARVALSVVRLAADPLPGRRHGTRRARGPRHLPGPARRAPRSRRRRAPRRGGAGHRCLRRGSRSTSSSGRAS